MTPKQARFVAEYPRDCNATRAAIRAGYSPNTANEQGARLLANVSIRTKIDAALHRMGEKAGLTAERIIEYLLWIANADIRELFHEDGTIIPFHEMPRHVAYTIASLNVEGATIRLRFEDRLRAIELLGKRLGLFSGAGMEQPANPTPQIDFSGLDTEELRRMAGMVRCPAKCCSLEKSGSLPPHLTLSGKIHSSS